MVAPSCATILASTGTRLSNTCFIKGLAFRLPLFILLRLWGLVRLRTPLAVYQLLPFLPPCPLPAPVWVYTILRGKVKATAFTATLSCSSLLRTLGKLADALGLLGRWVIPIPWPVACILLCAAVAQSFILVFSISNDSAMRINKKPRPVLPEQDFVFSSGEDFFILLSHQYLLLMPNLCV